MTDAQSHLTEEERHAFAEGSLPPEQVAPTEAHLHGCTACTDDVARIRTLMTRIREAPTSVTSPPLDELWPSIRTRIEASKVVPLSPNAIRLDGRRRARRVGSSIMLAAALVIAAVTLGVRARSRGPMRSAQPTDAASLIAVADSAHAYEEEAQILLNQLELRRSMLRPEAVVVIDHDLHVVDSAIAELKEAIVHDPNNPALRRLLASSYRQKVDLLKRVGNAS
jgi:hypothetical protein